MTHVRDERVNTAAWFLCLENGEVMTSKPTAGVEAVRSGPHTIALTYGSHPFIRDLHTTTTYISISRVATGKRHHH